MAFRKIKAGLVNADVEQFVGEIGNLFFDIDTGILRLSDGLTPGGNIVSGGSGGGSNYTLPTATTTIKGGVKIDGTTIAIDNQVISVGTVPYTSISGAPTVPTKVSDLTNDTGFITGVSWSQVTGKPTLFSGAYADLTGKPTNVSSFTNDSGYLTLSSLSSYATQSYVTSRGYITSSSLPTAVSELSNDSGFLTESNFDLNTINYDSNNKLHSTGILPGDVDGFTAIFAGRAAGIAALPNTVIQSQAQVNDYAQNNFQNTYDGNHASTEWVATSPNGSDTDYYIDLGINGASWDGTASNSLYDNVGQRDGWLYVQGGNAGGGNLVLGTSVANTYTKIIAGNVATGDREVARFSSTEVKLSKQLTFSDNTTQTTAYPGPQDLSSYATQTYVTTRGYITNADLPSLSGYATKTGEETLTNKTLTSPTLTDPTFTGTFAFESTNTTQPAMTLTANSLNDGVGILRVIGSEPDINFNQVGASPGFNTFTFEYNGDGKIAMGRRNDHSFYITRKYANAWHDNTFVLDYTTGVLSVEAGIATGSIDFGIAGTQTEPFLGFGSLSLGDMGDVDLTTPPTIGQVLKFDGTKWAPGTDITSGGAGTDADTLDGFDSSYFLNYNNFTNKPSLATVATSGSYTDLTNKPTIPTTVTVNGTALTLGSSGTITANTTNALTVGYGLTGTASTFDGSAANTVKLDTSSTAVTATSGGTLTLSAATMTPNYVVTGGATGGTYTIKLPDLTTLNVGQQITFFTTASLIAWTLSNGTSIVTNANSGSVARATTFTVISNAANATTNLAFTALPTTGSTVGTGTALVTNSSSFISSLGTNSIDNSNATLAVGPSCTAITVSATTGTFTHTLNLATAPTAATYTKTVNIGTALNGGTSTINIGTGVTTGTATLNLGSTSTTTTMNGAVTITSLTATNSIVGSITGNAATATKLGTARAINGVNFDGSAAITITAANPNALTIGSGLSGTSYDGSTAVTIAIDSTVALKADTHYIGTTSIALNRASASQTLTGVSIDGNAATVTNGVYTSGTYANPAWITSLAYSKLTGTPSLFSGSYTDLTNKPTIYSTAYIGTTSLDFTRASASQTLTGVSIDGNAATVTNGLYSTSSYSNPSWLTSLAYSKLTGAPTVPTNVSQLTNDSGYVTNSVTTLSSLTSVGTLSSLTINNPNNGIALSISAEPYLPLGTQTWAFRTGTALGAPTSWISFPDGTNQLTAYTGNAATVTNGVYTTDTGTVTNTMLAGSIANAKLANSSITVNGSAISLGGSATITASNPNALTIGTGLSGTSYTGSSAVTIAIDSTVVTLTGAQTLLSKNISGSNNTITNIANSSLSNSSITVGTTSISLGSSSTTLGGMAWITFAGSTSGTTQLRPSAIAGTTTVTMPGTTGTLITTGDTGTVTNTMLAGSIATSKITGLATSATTDTTNASNITSGTLPNARLSSVPNSALANSSISVNGTSISLGGSGTITVNSISASGFTGILGFDAAGSLILSNTNKFRSPSGLTIETGTSPLKDWTFSTTGTLTFPDATVQSTAYTGNAATVTNGVYTTDTGTVTNTMLAGSIANAKLANSSITVNGTSISLGGSATITAVAAAGTLTGTTLNSTVVTSSLTSVGTLTGLTSSGNITITNAGASTHGTGAQLYVNGSSYSRIDFGAVYADPTANSRSTGTRLLLNPSTGLGRMDCAIGMSSTNLWSSVQDPNFNFSWHAGDGALGSLPITLMTLSGAGILTVPQTNSVTANRATKKAIAVGDNGQIFDDGQLHIHAETNLWINTLDSSAIKIGTQYNSGSGSNVELGKDLYADSGSIRAYNGFVAGSGAISAVALEMPREAAIRNTYNGANNNMYFDVSIGGTSHGNFAFRSSSSYTQVLTMSPTGVTFNSGATMTAQTPALGRTSYNVALDTVVTVDNLKYRISNQGGVFPQIASASGSQVDVCYDVLGIVNGTSNPAYAQNSGYLLNANGTWLSIYSSHGMDARGDRLTAHITDKAAGKIYRATYMKTNNSGNADGYNIIVERIL